MSIDHNKMETYETLNHKADLLEDLLVLEGDEQLCAVYKAHLLNIYQQMADLRNSMNEEELAYLNKYDQWLGPNGNA